MSVPDLHTTQVLESDGFDTALRFHMSARLFPPVHAVFTAAFTEAIEAMRDDDAARIIELPNGREMRARDIVKSANLWNFITDEAEE